VGYTVACCIADEVALSSPYSERGALWDGYRRYFRSHDAQVLVAQAPSKTMNPALPQRVIDQAYDRDPESAKAEYGAQFRSDLEAFIDREVVESVTQANPLKLPFNSRNRYVAFVDPAGGGQDEYTLAIGHKESLFSAPSAFGQVRRIIKTCTEAAQTAHDNLLPLIDAAIASAKDRLEKAKACADYEAIAPKLVALIDCADTPRGDAVPSMIQTYAALLNRPATTDGLWLMRSLLSSVKHHGLTSGQHSWHLLSTQSC